MLLPAPSVKADVELAKNAYSFRLPTFGRSNHVVVAVIDVLPGLLPLPWVKVKLTAWDESETVIESFSTAFRLMVLAPEFTTCACAPAASTRTASAIVASLAPNCGLSFIARFRFIPRTAQGWEPQHPPSAANHRDEITESPGPECSASRCRCQPEVAARYRHSGRC